MTMATVSGTFSATGQSTAIVGRVIDVAMDFAGTASVDVERQMPSGAWIKIETAITADYSKVAEFPGSIALRLNCTAHTNNVEYVMQTGAEG